MRVRLFAFLSAYGIGAVASAQNIATFDEIVDASFENAVSTSGIVRFEEIAENLYWVGNVTHNTVFLVTDDGIILTDPINTNFSTELKARIEERFDVPVRYVLYSHHHWDHASGGAVWSETARFIGHENMLAHLAMPSAATPLPADAGQRDANGNGRLEREEIEETFSQFTLYDANGDGALTGAEIVRGPVSQVRPPDVMFSDRAAITLGGQSVEIVYTGAQTHTDDMSVVVFPEQRVAYMVDFVSIRRPPRFMRGEEPIDTWIDAIKVVETLDFEIAAPGHGAVGEAEYVILFREYLEKLRDEVAAGIAAGETLEALQESIYMPEYADWISYDEFRTSNIAEMYGFLTRE